MSITNQLVDRITHQVNAVSGSGGTAIFDIDLSTYANGISSMFELRANVQGTSFNSGAFDGFKRRTTATFSWDSSAHTRLAAVVSGSTNPLATDFTNDCADTNFSTSTAVWTALSSSTSARLTITNNGTGSNDFAVYVEVYQTSNNIASPLQISSCKLWLRADLGVTTSGSAVTAWNDQSGNGNNFSQGTAANQPTLVSNVYNGHPAIRGSSDKKRNLTNSTFTLSSPASIIFVCTQSTVSTVYLGGQSSTSSSFIDRFSTTKIEWFNGNGSDRQTLVTAPTTGLHMLAVTQTNASSLIGYYDGTQAFSVTPTAVIAAPHNLMNTATNNNGTDGDFAEVICYNKILTSTEITALHKYIQTFWGAP